MFSSFLVKSVLEYTDVNAINLSVFTFKNFGLFVFKIEKMTITISHII